MRNSSMLACASSSRRKRSRATMRWFKSMSSDSLSRSISMGIAAPLPAGAGPCLTVEFIEQDEPLLRAAALGAQPIAILGILLGERHGGPFLDELVDAHPAGAGERLQALMLGVGQTDRQGRHRETPSMIKRAMVALAPCDGSSATPPAAIASSSTWLSSDMAVLPRPRAPAGLRARAMRGGCSAGDSWRRSRREDSACSTTGR